MRERKKREKGPKKRPYGGGKSTSEIVFRGSEVVFSSSEVVFFDWACSLENEETEKGYKGEAGGCASRREVFYGRTLPYDSRASAGRFPHGSFGFVSLHDEQTSLGTLPLEKNEKRAQEQKRADANPTNSEKKRKFAHKFYI